MGRASNRKWDKRILRYSFATEQARSWMWKLFGHHRFFAFLAGLPRTHDTL